MIVKAKYKNLKIMMNDMILEPKMMCLWKHYAFGGSQDLKTILAQGHSRGRKSDFSVNVTVKVTRLLAVFQRASLVEHAC